MSRYYYNLASVLSRLLAQYSIKSAIRYENKSYTFLEVCSTAISWAEYLISLNISTNDTLAIKTDKSINSYCAVLACNILGVAYAHLDPNSPKEREEYVLKTLNPEWMLDFVTNKTVNIQDHNAEELPDYSNLIDLKVSNISEKISMLSRNTNGDTTAYVMFTSGSTGRPKGVAISQSSLINFIDWVAATYSVNENDCFSGLNQSHFDNSIFDLYGSIYNGAALAPISTEQLKFPQKVLKKLLLLKTTVWFSVPSYLIYCLKLKSIKPATTRSFRVIIFGGEGFPKASLKKLAYFILSDTRLFNVYGPTEATCICSSYEITEKDFANLNSLAPLGVLAPNFDYKIINKNKEGVGELLLAGPQIAQGYLNNHELTAQRFEFIDERGLSKRSYYTGDLVKLSDGLLYFKGRVDNQIKHMGYRIELEEIESYFNAVDEIIECVAVHLKLDDNISRIELHVVCDARITDKTKMVNSIIKRLPTYMQPSAVHFNNSLPKNANGKINRRGLNTAS